MKKILIALAALLFVLAALIFAAPFLLEDKALAGYIVAFAFMALVAAALAAVAVAIRFLQKRLGKNGVAAFFVIPLLVLVAVWLILGEDFRYVILE